MTLLLVHSSISLRLPVCQSMNSTRRGISLHAQLPVTKQTHVHPVHPVHEVLRGRGGGGVGGNWKC